MEGKKLGKSSDTAAVEAKRRRKRDGEADLVAFLEKKRQKLEEEAKKPKRRPGAELLASLDRLLGDGQDQVDFTEPEWLGEKKMTKTDVHPHHQRLFIPRSVVEKPKPHLKAWEKGETEPVDAPGILVSIVDLRGTQVE